MVHMVTFFERDAASRTTSTLTKKYLLDVVCRMATRSASSYGSAFREIGTLFVGIALPPSGFFATVSRPIIFPPRSVFSLSICSIIVCLINLRTITLLWRHVCSIFSRCYSARLLNLTCISFSVRYPIRGHIFTYLGLSIRRASCLAYFIFAAISLFEESGGDRISLHALTTHSGTISMPLPIRGFRIIVSKRYNLFSQGRLHRLRSGMPRRGESLPGIPFIAAAGG